MRWKCSNPIAMVTDMIKWLWELPASKISNSKLSKQRQVVSMFRRILLLQCKPKLGCTKPLTGLHGSRELDISGLEVGLMCLAILGVANQSETKEPRFLLCYNKELYHVHYTWAHMNITPSFPHIHICLASFIVNITHHRYDNNRTLQGIYCYACYWVSGTSGTRAAWNWAKSQMWLAKRRLATPVLYIVFNVSAKWKWTCIQWRSQLKNLGGPKCMILGE